MGLEPETSENRSGRFKRSLGMEIIAIFLYYRYDCFAMPTDVHPFIPLRLRVISKLCVTSLPRVARSVWPGILEMDGI